MKPQPCILLVEDDPIDVEMMVQALGDAGSSRPMLVASNGREALDLLKGASGQAELARPVVVLLDLRMPVMDGETCLKTIRADADLRELPVFVLSTSATERHKAGAYRLGISGYFAKSSEANRMRAIAMLVENYCELTELP